MNGSEIFSGLDSASCSGDTTYSHPANVKEALLKLGIYNQKVFYETEISNIFKT